MGRRTNKNSEERYLVRTSLGNTILPGKATVPSNISGDLYVPKPVSHLNTGEMVLYRKEGIDKTLDEIEPQLKKSHRYSLAEETLHISRGDSKTTKFRYDLITGLCDASKVDISRADLESRLFVDEGVDDSEYEPLIDAVQEALTNGGHPHDYVRSTIKSWLTGETLAPRDWSTFEALSSTVPNFADYNNTREGGGIKDDYHLYVVVRQGIMRYLSSGGSSKLNSQRNDSSDRSKGVSLSKEIDLVVSEFMEDVNETYALARVLGINPISNVGKKRIGKERPKNTLADTVQVNLPKDLDVRTTNYNTLVSDRELLRQSLQLFFADFSYKAHKERHWSKDFVVFPEHHVDCPGDRSHILHTLMKKKHSEDVMVNDTISNLNQLGYTFDNSVLDRLYQHLHGGGMDTDLDLPQSTLMGILNIESRLMACVPNQAWRMFADHRNAVQVESWNEDDNQLKRNTRKIEKKLDEVFGIKYAQKVKGLLPVRIQSDISEAMELGERQSFSAFRKSRNVQSAKRFAAKLIKDPQEKAGIMTKIEVTKALERYDLANLVELFPATTFVSDELLAK